MNPSCPRCGKDLIPLFTSLCCPVCPDDTTERDGVTRWAMMPPGNWRIFVGWRLQMFKSPTDAPRDGRNVYEVTWYPRDGESSESWYAIAKLSLTRGKPGTFVVERAC